jgi:hypothetical protein
MKTPTGCSDDSEDEFQKRLAKKIRSSKGQQSFSKRQKELLVLPTGLHMDGK